MHCELANTIAAEACALRLMYPDAPAREVLALICNGRDLAALDFGQLTRAPHPFERLVAEALAEAEADEAGRTEAWLVHLQRQWQPLHPPELPHPRLKPHGSVHPTGSRQMLDSFET